MRRSHLTGVLAAAALAVAATAAPRAARAQLYTQCPAVNYNTGCGALITVNPGGTFTVTLDPTQGPYDGSDDALVGVLNNSGTTLSSLVLDAPGVDIFGFDGDGICSYNLTCTWAAPTGYEGPITFFTNIGAGSSSGTVNFAGGLADGASTYFGLENSPARIVASDPGVIATPTTAPEPATFALSGVGLAALALGGLRRRRTA